MIKYTKEMFVLEKPDLNHIDEWDIVAGSSIFEDEFKDKEAEKEIIFSYANALNCVATALQGQNHDFGNIMKFQRNSLSIPFIFLARHTVELCLKYLCVVLNIEYLHKHGLMILWDKISEKLYDPSKSDYFNGIKAFISAMEDLDCNESYSRYSKNNRGELHNPKPKFINAENINEVIQEIFVKLVNTF